MKKIVLEINDAEFNLLNNAASIAGVSLEDLCLYCFYRVTEGFKDSFDTIKFSIFNKKL